MLHSECTNVMCGALKAALSFHTAFKNDIKATGFELNPHDRCAANKEVNGKQMTIVWHVDDVKMSHDEDEVLDGFIECLRDIHDDEEIGTLKVDCGPRHEFPGMTSDCSEPGKATVDMSDGASKMAEEFEEKYEPSKIAKTPAAAHSFKMNENGEKLNEDMASDFHTHSAKGSFFCKQGRPDTQTATAFLTVRVKEPDQDDWKKSLRKMAHLKGAKDMVLTLEADDLRLVHWHIDASFAVHYYM